MPLGVSGTHGDQSDGGTKPSPALVDSAAASEESRIGHVLAGSGRNVHGHLQWKRQKWRPLGAACATMLVPHSFTAVMRISLVRISPGPRQYLASISPVSRRDLGSILPGPRRDLAGILPGSCQDRGRERVSCATLRGSVWPVRIPGVVCAVGCVRASSEPH